MDPIKTPKVHTDEGSAVPLPDAYVKAAWEALGSSAVPMEHLVGHDFEVVDQHLAAVDEAHTSSSPASAILPFSVQPASSSAASTDSAPAAAPAAATTTDAPPVPGRSSAPSSGAGAGAGAASGAAVSSSARHGTRTWAVPPQYQSWDINHDRFEIVKQLGKGSYGSVLEALDHHNGGERVAIKRVTDVFSVFDNALRILREVAILRQLHHPNIVKLIHLEMPRDRAHFTDLYIVFNALDLDLLKLSRDITQSLTLDHVRWFMYQILKATVFMHSAGIIHRDLKPANILATEGCDISVCDFGLARTSTSGGTPTAAAPSERRAATGEREFRRKLTKHVVTRWYRAPELPLFNDGVYTEAIDVWSLGCILAELLGMMAVGPDRAAPLPLFPGSSCLPLSRGPSFYAGSSSRKRSQRDQLLVILSVLGTPSEADAQRARTAEARAFLVEQARTNPQERADFKDRYPDASDEVLQLLNMMLQLFPEDRPTSADLLSHPFFDVIRVPESELVAGGKVHLPRITPDNVRQLMLNEIDQYNAAAAAASTPPHTAPPAVAPRPGSAFDGVASGAHSATSHAAAHPVGHSPVNTTSEHGKKCATM